MKQKRAAAFELSKAESRKNFMASPEYQKMIDERTATEIETQKMIKQKAEMDLFNKAVEHNKEAQLAKNVQQAVVDQHMNTTKEATYYIEQEAKTVEQQTQKMGVIKKLNEYRIAYLELWGEFVGLYQGADINNTSSFINLPLEELNAIYSGFAKYVAERVQNGYSKPANNQNDTEPQQQMPQLPLIPEANPNVIQLPQTDTEQSSLAPLGGTQPNGGDISSNEWLK